MMRSGGTVSIIVASVILVGKVFAFSSARITRLSRISAENTRSASAIEVPKVADWISTVTKLATSTHAGAFGHVAQHADLVLAGLDLVGDHLEFVGQRGEAGADFLGDADDRLVQRLAGLDADQHHVQRVGKAVGDLLLALLLALGDPVFRQHVAGDARAEDRQSSILVGIGSLPSRICRIA